jgi:hypothetical protein
MRISRTVVAGLASAAIAASGLAGTAVTSGNTPQSAAGQTQTTGSGLRLNQTQFIGAHNAYHREAPDDEKKIMLAQDPGSIGLFYSHASIPAQLEDQNIRAVELDLFPDPQGGLYTYPLIRKMAGKGPLTDPDLAKPGIKVLHWADWDYDTTCSTFVKCLTQVKDWSTANPGHAPILIQLELKQSDPRLVAAP